MQNTDIYPHNISRRNAFKYLSLSPLLASSIAKASTKVSDTNAKIVILGGGIAGISTAARLKRFLSNPDITIIESDELSPSYNEGLTLVAAGIWDINEIKYKRNSKIPYGVKLIKGNPTSFDPSNNTLIVDDKIEVIYEQLIVASAIELNFNAIKGLKGSISSTGDSEDVLKSGVTKNGLHSLHFHEGASATWNGIQELIEKAKKHTGHKKLQAIFTYPDTAIKCASAPISMMYLLHARLEEAKVREKIEITFYTNDKKIIEVSQFHDAIIKLFDEKEIKHKCLHKLIKIDVSNKTMLFYKQNKEREKYEKIELSYDFLHITPPMKVPDTLGDSELGSQRGWIPINQETMQHLKFKNVWSLGDITAIPLGKTLRSLHKQYEVLVDNIIASIKEKKTLPLKYDGYTAYPFITDIGKVMLVEFDWSMQAKPLVQLKSTQERWIWWLLEVYALKPLTTLGMLKGYA